MADLSGRVVAITGASSGINNAGEDVATTILFALAQPPRVAVHELLVLPSHQR